ncbi:MAG TPA: hypothetical protein VNQ53_14080 [Nocardioides sp.]|nr:hypothetical protein [Nocardioides sp.]
MTDRRTAVWLLALALPLAVAGCGDDGGPPPAAPSPTEALWNPCDALDAKGVGRAFGTSATEADGTATSPSCSFSPRTTGDPVVDANYVLFPEGLDAAWETMGRSETAVVTSPKVPGADDTRLVVHSDAHQLYVSGFVQNGDLIQTVDAVDPKPFDRDRAVTAVTWALGRLSAHAAESGVS